MSFHLHQISYKHADGNPLFEGLSFYTGKGDKLALIGDNGCGKSTLLRIMSGFLQPTAGEVIRQGTWWYVPQHTGSFAGMTVAGALGVSGRIRALRSILEGDVDPEHFTVLADDWTIEERVAEALCVWGLPEVTPDTPMDTLSGGEKTKVFLAGIRIHEPDTVLMDEPTNHLDRQSREVLYRYVKTTSTSLLIVSHDITLLNLLPVTVELSAKGLQEYGGNYDFYKLQKELHLKALEETVGEQEKALRQARKTARETMERKNKLDARGHKLGEKKGISRMAMNTLKDKAEKSTTRLNDKHVRKMEDLSDGLKSLYKELPENRSLKIVLQTSSLHIGKRLIWGGGIQYRYGDKNLWEKGVDLDIRSGERWLIRGRNGAGKTTLFRLIMGEIEPVAGELNRADHMWLYIDQEYSMLDSSLTVLGQLEKYNTSSLPDHELKIRLARFLFPPDSWNKSCDCLSGGEKVRLVFCCLTTGNQSPDMLLLDEPTNNLDIKSADIIIEVLKSYQGTIIAVSHDDYFIRETGLEKELTLVAKTTHDQRE